MVVLTWDLTHFDNIQPLFSNCCFIRKLEERHCTSRPLHDKMICTLLTSILCKDYTEALTQLINVSRPSTDFLYTLQHTKAFNDHFMIKNYKMNPIELCLCHNAMQCFRYIFERVLCSLKQRQWPQLNSWTRGNSRSLDSRSRTPRRSSSRRFSLKSCEFSSLQNSKVSEIKTIFASLQDECIYIDTNIIPSFVIEYLAPLCREYDPKDNKEHAQLCNIIYD